MENITKEEYSFVIIWKTRNKRSLFNLKDKGSHVSSLVYEGKSNCGESYIDETGRNGTTIRWDEHSDISKNSEPTKHLYHFPEHRFDWKILRGVPNKLRQRKFLEAYHIMCLRPTRNNLSVFGTIPKWGHIKKSF